MSQFTHVGIPTSNVSTDVAPLQQGRVLSQKVVGQNAVDMFPVQLKHSPSGLQVGGQPP